jgi:hypothetical protein
MPSEYSIQHYTVELDSGERRSMYKLAMHTEDAPGTGIQLVMRLNQFKRVVPVGWKSQGLMNLKAPTVRDTMTQAAAQALTLLYPLFVDSRRV